MYKFFLFSFVLFLLNFSSSIAIEQSAEVQVEPKEETPGVPTRDFYSEFVNMLFTLGLIVLVLFLVAWIFKRLMHSRIQQMNITSVIKILETRAISTKLSLHLIEVEGKGIIFAESAGGIEKLADIDLTESEQDFQSILDQKKTT